MYCSQKKKREFALEMLFGVMHVHDICDSNALQQNGCDSNASKSPVTNNPPFQINMKKKKVSASYRLSLPVLIITFLLQTGGIS